MDVEEVARKIAEKLAKLGRHDLLHKASRAAERLGGKAELLLGNPTALSWYVENLDLPPVVMDLRLLGRIYLDVQALRMSAESRRRVMEAVGGPEPFMKAADRTASAMEALEEEILDTARQVMEGSPLWEWCARTKGLGPASALAFAAFINPYRCDTAGKARKYMGLVPGVARRSGERAGYNPVAKARAFLAARGVIMHRDDYYYPLYQAKKRYYMEVSPYRYIFAEGKVDPSRCPRYATCKAKKGCKGHINSMAVRWLAGLLVSHAAELYREWLGLPTDNFKAHRGYIPPKPYMYSQDELSRLCRQVERGLK